MLRLFTYLFVALIFRRWNHKNIKISCSLKTLVIDLLCPWHSFHCAIFNNASRAQKRQSQNKDNLKHYCWKHLSAELWNSWDVTAVVNFKSPGWERTSLIMPFIRNKNLFKMSPRQMFFIYRLKSRFWNHARLLSLISYYFLQNSIFKHKSIL